MLTPLTVFRRVHEPHGRLELPAEKVAQLGPQNDAHGWGFEAPCGLEFGIEPEGNGWFVLHCETGDEFDHAMMHLPFDWLRVKIERAPSERRGLGWLVKRTDFSENTFVVGEYPREQSARCVCAEFVRRGHHQDYFVVSLARVPEPRRPWLVKRIDDNGNEFTVEAHVWGRGAEAHVAELSAEPRHKQTYWVEALASG